MGSRIHYTARCAIHLDVRLGVRELVRHTSQILCVLDVGFCLFFGGVYIEKRGTIFCGESNKECLSFIHLPFFSTHIPFFSIYYHNLDVIKELFIIFNLH